MTLSILNAKGGVGKSTISINLAFFLSLMSDKRVLLIDTDPQRSVSIWEHVRKPLSIGFDTLYRNDISSFIKEANEIFDFIIIDTSGSDSEVNRDIIKNTNSVIIPTHTGGFDIAVLNSMIDFFDSAKQDNSNLRGYILINRVSTNPKVKHVANLQELIKNKGLKNLKLLNSVLCERIVYQQAISMGKSIFEICKSNDKSIVEFKNFCNELLVEELILS